VDIYPILTYRDVEAALDQLEAAFGFERVVYQRDDDGRVALAAVTHGEGLVPIQPDDPEHLHGSHIGQAWTYVVVPDADAHCERARAAGATILSEPHDAGDGLRGYTAADLDGNVWTFGTTQLARS
jgi:uncharacterized glyoxalase superfamily protein PhnB